MAKTLTIAVCSHNKNFLLLDTIKECQKFRGNDVKLIIVHSGNEGISISSNLADMYYFNEKMGGLSTKRNFAISKCTTDYIAFMDDDCIPGEGWIEYILSGFKKDENVKSVVGRIKQYTDKGSQHFDKRLDYDKMGDNPRLIRLTAFRFVNIMKIGTGGNMAFCADIFAKIGNFDENLGAGSIAYAGEDKDILYRVLKAGYSIYYEPKAVIYHNDTIGENNLLYMAYRYSYGTQAILRKHGDFCCIILYLLGLSKYLLEYIFSISDKARRQIVFNLLKGLLGIR
ncbi:MAG: glycosyltransferase [Candidatus Omnitrophota bacterium]